MGSGTLFQEYLEDAEDLSEFGRHTGIGRHSGLEQVDNQVGAEWQADEWIRTQVWILEVIGGGNQEGLRRRCRKAPAGDYYKGR
jgi:hypothetical protein